MHENLADTWLQILVTAMLTPQSSNDKMVLLPSQRVNMDLRYGLELLKRDLNVSSIANVIIYCIKFTLQCKGIRYERQQHQVNNKSKPDLW